MDEMCEELKRYAEQHELEWQSADEMLWELDEEDANYQSHREYLYDFIRRWDELEESEL